MTTERKCPNCGAGIRDDGVSPSLACPFCGTHVAVERPQPDRDINININLGSAIDVDRRPRLEAERRQLAAIIDAKADKYRPRIVDARAHRLGNFVWPPFFGCAAGMAVFFGGVAWLMVRYADDATPRPELSFRLLVLSGVVFLAVLFLVAWMRRRPGQQTAWQLEQERDAAVYEARKRLEAIDAELQR